MPLQIFHPPQEFATAAAESAKCYYLAKKPRLSDFSGVLRSVRAASIAFSCSDQVAVYLQFARSDDFSSSW